MHSEEEGDLDVDFVKRGYVKKLKKVMAPGPAVSVGESIAKKFGTIEPLVLEIWLSQISCVNCADFVFICVLTSFSQTAIIPMTRTYVIFRRHLSPTLII